MVKQFIRNTYCSLDWAPLTGQFSKPGCEHLSRRTDFAGSRRASWKPMASCNPFLVGRIRLQCIEIRRLLYNLFKSTSEAPTDGPHTVRVSLRNIQIAMLKRYKVFTSEQIQGNSSGAQLTTNLERFDLNSFSSELAGLQSAWHYLHCRLWN